MTTCPPRVALVTCTAYPDLFEDDRPLVPALASLGIGAQPAVWSDDAVEWGAFDALVMRTPWDYFERDAAFRAWLDARMAAGARLLNDADTLAWNYDKRYLLDLAAAGVPVVPTAWIAPGETADVGARARARGWDEIVVKPSVSGGAYRTHRFRADDAAAYADEVAGILQDRGVLVQPFLPEILTDGEWSLLFFDGAFSHAVRKRARVGEYRVQFSFGGTTERAEPAPEWIEQAAACVRATPSPTVYARVDGVIVGGRFLLMELEVFEPLMFLAAHPEAPARFARAIARRLAERA